MGIGMFAKIIGMTAVIVGLGINSEYAADTKGTTQKDSGYTSWAGFNWGLGIATNFDVGGARVNNATVVNNIVRVDDTTGNVGISFVLEAHYFLRDSLFGPGDSCTRAAIEYARQ